MERQYFALPIRELGLGAGFRRPLQKPAERVSLESPAIEVMTDLARVSPATIAPRSPLAAANRLMIARGVRLLLVVDEQEHVEGVITATDILGPRSTLEATARGLRSDELTVADVMTPAELVEAIALSDVEGARVGHVLETLRRAGRQHALVIDHEIVPPSRPLERPVERAMVRGIFSLSQLARQLGVAVPTAGQVARTFSEIEAALSK